MTVSFGRYSVRLIGEEKLLALFPSSWQNSVETSDCGKPDAVLNIQSGLSEYDKSSYNGWKACDGCGKRAAVYFSQGKAMFEIKHDPADNRVDIRLCDNSIRCFHIGMQYGVMLALYTKCVGLHGVTLLCGDEIVILSAPSGTGKTTLASLLETYSDAVVINGDFALLSLSDEGVIFEPTPFCGSSGRCLNHRVRVNRVVFLEQAADNRWRKLSGRDAMIRFMANCFIPEWDKSIGIAIQDSIVKCITALKINAFSFAPEKDAAELFYARLRDSEEQSS